jgi:hypothetical protein
MSLENLLLDRQIDADPFAVPSGRDHCGTTPSTFNVREIRNFFDKPVPLEFSIYTKIPDSLINALVFFDLDGAEIKILLYIHKLTLGYINHTQSYHTQKTRSLPMNTVEVAYGKFSEQGNKAVRNRFVRVTVRQLAKALKVPKSTMHRKIKKLQAMRMVQLVSDQYKGTDIGINYFTIESTFSQIPAFKSGIEEYLEVKVGNGLLSHVTDHTFVPKLAIENMINCLGPESIFDKGKVNPNEKLLMMGTFRQNHYLLEAS